MNESSNMRIYEEQMRWDIKTNQYTLR